jgi:hypothetical protein
MTLAPRLHRQPDTPDGDDAGIRRSVDLLLRLEAWANGRARGSDARLPVLCPIADMVRDHGGQPGDMIVMACVYVDTRDGKGRQRFALHELRLAADALDADPSYPAARMLAAALRWATGRAMRAAHDLQRSLEPAGG